MKDTTDRARQLQLDIIHSKTEEERARLGVDMIDSAYTIVRNSVQLKLPHIKERELTAEVFLRYYSNEFTADQLRNIADKIKKYRRK